MKNLNDTPNVHQRRSLLGVLQLGRWTTAPVLKIMLLEGDVSVLETWYQQHPFVRMS